MLEWDILNYLKKWRTNLRATVLADYGELYQLRRENKSLSDTNESLESELNTLLDQLAIPSARNLIFAVADALIGGQPVPVFLRRWWLDL